MNKYLFVLILLWGCNNYSKKYTLNPDKDFLNKSYETYITFNKHSEDTLGIICNCNFDSLDNNINITLWKKFPSKSYLNGNRKQYYSFYQFNKPSNILNQFSELNIAIDHEKVIDMSITKGSQEYLIEDKFISKKKISNYQLTLNQYSPSEIEKMSGILTTVLPLNFGWKNDDKKVTFHFNCGKSSKLSSKQNFNIKSDKLNSFIKVVDKESTIWQDSKFNDNHYTDNVRYNFITRNNIDSTVYINLYNKYSSNINVFIKIKSLEDISTYAQRIIQTCLPAEDTSDIHVYPIEHKQLIFNKNPLDLISGDTIEGRFHVLGKPELLLYGNRIEELGSYKLVMGDNRDSDIIEYYEKRIDFLNTNN